MGAVTSVVNKTPSHRTQAQREGLLANQWYQWLVVLLPFKGSAKAKTDLAVSHEYKAPIDGWDSMTETESITLVNNISYAVQAESEAGTHHGGRVHLRTGWWHSVSRQLA
jgi:hypothetical protein